MRALISVSNKHGVVEFAKSLEHLGWEIISTSGTLRILQENGVQATAVEDITGFPEICNGRVKTLHPNIHGALLARREIEEDMQTLLDNAITPIDLVCVNLYPFRETIAKEGVTMDDAIENIDIGGPSMLRSAAKNWKSVTVVVHPDDYNFVLQELQTNGKTSDTTRLQLSAKAFTHTAEYDMAIATYMRKEAQLNERLFLEFEKKQDLRYGENPHQKASFYAAKEALPFSLAHAKQLNGKALSYNNIQDANACLQIVREFEAPFAVGLKHMNPCGAAIGATIEEAWRKTYEADKVSIFGGIVAFNREVTLEVAQMLKPIFLEIVMAPSFSADALQLLSQKKNLRILEIDMRPLTSSPTQYVSVMGGLLVQDMDIHTREVVQDMCVTQRQPTEQELQDLNFAWRIVKHVKSNAIVVVKNGMTLGIGAGQMNRIGSAHLAIEEAIATLREQPNFDSALPCKDVVLASDGFFPFDDNVKYAFEHGIRAIIQPGGSIRDNDSIDFADKHDMTMLFTGQRHFKH